MAAPVGYLGVPEDVANLVSFIVKKESHFITGEWPPMLGQLIDETLNTYR